jgi:hypothetical protein
VPRIALVLSKDWLGSGLRLLCVPDRRLTLYTPLLKPAKIVRLDHFGGRKSEDFAENPLPHISMFTSSRCWSDFGRISQQIRGFQIDYECGLYRGLSKFHLCGVAGGEGGMQLEFITIGKIKKKEYNLL